jgi:hypothetical protein
MVLRQSAAESTAPTCRMMALTHDV